LERLMLDTTVLVTVQRSATSLDAVIEDEDDVAIAAITAGSGGALSSRTFSQRFRSNHTTSMWQEHTLRCSRTHVAQGALAAHMTC